MLFRPSFCANCGEKIERPEWFLWTSRRFCQVCEIEFKGQDLIPKVIICVGILASVISFGNYLKSGTGGSDLQALKQPRKFVEQPQAVTKLTAANTVAATPENTMLSVNGQREQRNFSSTSGEQSFQPPAKPKADAVQPVHYCGAETKKGTACSRRVKGNIRCFQHLGMPVMASAEKLSVR